MDFDMPTLDEIKSFNISLGTYTVHISPSLHDRIERHILILKKLMNEAITKKRWLVYAIEEKLENDKDKNEIPKAKSLNININKELEEKVSSKVNFIKKFRKSYSKKQWFLEAIIEKLERDEKETEKKIHDLRQVDDGKNTKEQIKQFQIELEALKNKLSSLHP